MEPELLSRIFEPFIQADHAIARSRGGLGLGLALVKSLVELHGGEVWATSDGPGHGSQFIIELSLAEQPAPVTKPAEQIVSVVAGRRILVIEDNFVAARNLRLFLVESGHTVEVARNGPDGIEMARRFRPDVLLCDIGLPGLHGYAVAQTLRQEPGLKKMYMIAVSGYGQDADKRRALDAGFDAYFTKPIDLQEVAKLLANLIVHD
jgi:CheY-like chemotaxis protein